MRDGRLAKELAVRSHVSTSAASMGMDGEGGGGQITSYFIGGYRPCAWNIRSRREVSDLSSDKRPVPVA